MVNVLIADDNVSFATNLMNYLNEKNDNIRVCHIAKDGEETLEMLNSRLDIDVILLDLKMPKCDGIQVLEKIEDKDRYKNSFIVISGEMDFIRKLRSNDLIYSIIYKTTEMDKIILEIDQIILNKEKEKLYKDVRQSIIKELLYLGYDISYKGTQYLISVIEFYILSESYYVENLERNIYPKIAKKYNTSIHNIKANINRANNAMYCNCEMKKLKKYFVLHMDTKPKIKTVISTVANKIIK